jgi:hypothetical protein
MIHFLFDCCVSGMDRIANTLDPWFPGGMDYAKINVIICCFLIPAVLLASLGLNVLFIFKVI